MKLDESEAVYTSTGLRRRKRDDGNTSNVGLAGQFTGELNPLWVEWLMGFPPGWTDSELSETAVVPEVARTIGLALIERGWTR